MIEIHHRVIQGIPLLEVVDAQLAQQKIPTVIFFHGWTNVKESVLINGYELAKRGIRALLPEALYHGERQDGKTTEDHYPEFFQIVTTSVADGQTLIDTYVKEGKTDPAKVGFTGLSMGGITTCAAMATYDWLHSGVCLMGSPNLEAFAKGTIQKAEAAGMSLPFDPEKELITLREQDLSRYPERIAGRPLHFWHGTKDDTVPYQPTFDFYQQVIKESYGEHVSFTTTDDGHKVPVKISVEMANFFADHF